LTKPDRLTCTIDMKIRINLRTCRKTGQCYYTFPEWVRRGDDDGPEPLDEDVPQGKIEALNELVDCCPVGAIRLIKSTD